MTYMSPKSMLKSAALLAIIIACGASAARSLGIQTDHQMAEGILQSNYSEYNAKWFGNTLPKDTIVHYSAPPDQPNAMGLTAVEDSHFAIYVDPKYHHLNRKAAEFTLMHEMCHVAQWDAGDVEPHGAHWTACMTKLADDGALKEIW